MPTSCAVPSCERTAANRAQAGDLCVEHWMAWLWSPERQDLSGARIEHAADAYFRFLKRQDDGSVWRELWSP